MCGESADWFENLGGSISHEITEGVTDPDVIAVSSGCGSAWCDPQPGDALTPHAEIGDICETGSVTLYRFRDAQGATFAAQREWSNVAKACLGTAADAFSVALDPAEVWLPAGVPAQVQVSTTRPASGAALLDLGVPQPPAGLAVQLKASQIDAGSSTQVTVQIDAAPALPLRMPFFAESGLARVFAVAPVGVPDFTVDAPGAAVEVAAGGSANVSLATSARLGPAMPLASVSVPAARGLSARLVAGARVGDTAVAAISAAPGAPTSSDLVALSLTAGGRTHTVPVQVSVAGDDVGLAVPALAVAQGASARFAVRTSVLRGNPQRLTLLLEQLPAGTSARFEPAQVDAGSASTLVLSATSEAVLGEARVLLVAQGQVAAASAPAALVVSHHGGCASAGASPLAILGIALRLVRARRRRTR